MKVKRNGLRLGDWKVYCPVCGMGGSGSDLVKRWDGKWVCQRCIEDRHPQEFVRAVKDEQRVPVAYPHNIVSAYTLTENRVSTGYRSLSGSPVGVLTPKWDTEEVYDFTGAQWYRANGFTTSSWETF